MKNSRRDNIDMQGLGQVLAGVKKGFKNRIDEGIHALDNDRSLLFLKHNSLSIGRLQRRTFNERVFSNTYAPSPMQCASIFNPSPLSPNAPTLEKHPRSNFHTSKEGMRYVNKKFSTEEELLANITATITPISTSPHFSPSFPTSPPPP